MEQSVEAEEDDEEQARRKKQKDEEGQHEAEERTRSSKAIYSKNQFVWSNFSWIYKKNEAFERSSRIINYQRLSRYGWHCQELRRYSSQIFNGLRFED